MVETERGLAVTTKVSDTQGPRGAPVDRDGVVDELSIGFDPVKWEMVENEETKVTERHIRELRLWEFSPVTFAANSDARITTVHSLLQASGMTPELASDLRPVMTAIAAAGDYGAALALLIRTVAESHAGKVLSSKNRTLVTNAIEALQRLLTAAEPKDSKDSESRSLTAHVAAGLAELEVTALERGLLT